MQTMIAATAEWTSVLLNIAFAYLIGRSVRWGWWCGLVASVITLWLYGVEDAWLMAALNVFYALMAVYGWWNWGRDEGTVQVRTLPWLAHLWLAAGVALATWALVFAMEQLALPGRYQGMEAFIAASAMAATWLMGRKALENWAYWTVSDVVGVVYNHWIGYDGYAFLNVVYIALAVVGFVRWRRQLKADATNRP